MGSEANISDVAALEDFRRALIRFREDMGIAIAEADSVERIRNERCGGSHASRTRRDG